MQSNTRDRRRIDAVALLWTPWGAVPDSAGAREGKVARLRPRSRSVPHKHIGFDVRPGGPGPRRQ